MKFSRKCVVVIVCAFLVIGASEIVRATSNAEVAIPANVRSRLYGGDSTTAYPEMCCGDYPDCALTSIGTCPDNDIFGDELGPIYCPQDWEDDAVPNANKKGCINPTVPDSTLACFETNPNSIDCRIRYPCVWDPDVNPKCSRGAESGRGHAPKKCTYNKSQCP